MKVSWKCQRSKTYYEKETATRLQTIGDISMLNETYKIYAGVLNYRLKVTTERVLLEEQSGFYKE